VLLLPPALLLHATTTLAQENVPNFQHDPVESWATKILVWTLIIAILVVLYGLFEVYRGQTRGVGTRVLLFTGVFVLPVFTVSSGMLLMFVRAERVEFCGSCHQVLQPYVDDMENPEGEGLAALHFKNQYIADNQCYECHTSYGLFGTFQAKLNGITQVVRYYTESYERPIEMWRPYSNADCLKCHARSNKWLSNGAHGIAGMKESLFEDETSCMQCHTRAHPDAETEREST
jgi:nitrate/TMAO reductase-like tetraheme cytochrome c subunit